MATSCAAALATPLGFSRADRAQAVAGAGELALRHSEAGIVSVTALVSPYREDRDEVRRRHEEASLGFLEVWVSTPLELCIERDPKQLYARALRGELAHMTGIDDPYEEPLFPELVLGPELSAARWALPPSSSCSRPSPARRDPWSAAGPGPAA